MIDASPLLDDSGYETPTKRPRFEPLGLVSPALVSELESGYESLYLCIPGSLIQSYDNGLPPPLRNSAHKYLAALNVLPGWRRSIGSQLDRVEKYRNREKEEGPPQIVDLTED